MEHIATSDSAGCSCALEVSQQFSRWRRQHDGGEIYQSSLMSALLAGVYEGETTMSELLRHGDFGLGTFNDDPFSPLSGASLRSPPQP